MNGFFGAIEHTALSVWMREDETAYFLALIAHAIGMALLVGGTLVVALGTLRFTPAADPRALRGFRPVMVVGAILATLSGLLLLVAYPAKALTNPLFFLKLCLLAAATWIAIRLTSGTRPSARGAVALVITGLGVVVAGKLLLHTAKVLTVGGPAP